MSRAVASGKVGVRACPSGLMAGTYSMVASSSSSMSLSACFSISLLGGKDLVVNRRIPSREATKHHQPLQRRSAYARDLQFRI